MTTSLEGIDVARNAEVKHYASKGGYFCTFRGTRHRLASGPKDEPHGPTYSAALERFREIVRGGESGGST